jgi:hypothetical protein
VVLYLWKRQPQTATTDIDHYSNNFARSNWNYESSKDLTVYNSNSKAKTTFSTAAPQMQTTQRSSQSIGTKIPNPTIYHYRRLPALSPDTTLETTK